MPCRRRLKRSKKKSSPARDCDCKNRRRNKGQNKRDVLTAAGSVSVRRRYFTCNHCLEGLYPADRRLGINGSRTRQAERLLCLAGSSWSFAVAESTLEEFCGLKVSHQTIRAVCDSQGRNISRWRHENTEQYEEFAESEGDIEFSTDGTSVNTKDGWREMRIGIFSKRHRGETADANNWDKRKLPKPHVRVAFAAIEKSKRFGSRWARWTKRLSIRDTSLVTVLADGARWIWEEASMHLGGSSGVLDIFHALEHVSAAAAGLHGDGTDAAGKWLDGGRDALLCGGWPSMFEYLRSTRKEVPRGRWKNHGRPLMEYLGRQKEHLAYPQRLAAGQSIGSGQVEGACKNMVGRRLKQTGAQWRVRRVNRMATLCSTLYSGDWALYWENPH